MIRSIIFLVKLGGQNEMSPLPHTKMILALGLAADPQHREFVVDMAKRMWRKMDQIGDDSLLNTHYSTLRTAPIGPMLRQE